MIQYTQLSTIGLHCVNNCPLQTINASKRDSNNDFTRDLFCRFYLKRPGYIFLNLHTLSEAQVQLEMHETLFVTYVIMFILISCTKQFF